MHTYKSVFREYIHCNIRIILTVIILFVIGSIIGIILANNTDDNTKSEIIIYINDINESIANGNGTNTFQVLANTAKTIIICTIIVVFLGLNMFFSKLIYVVGLYKGISIGFSLSYIIMIFGNLKGTIFGLLVLLIPNLCLLVHIIFISVLWIKFKSKLQYESDNKIIVQNMALTAVSMAILGTFQVLYQLVLLTYIDDFIKIL